MNNGNGVCAKDSLRCSRLRESEPEERGASVTVADVKPRGNL